MIRSSVGVLVLCGLACAAPAGVGDPRPTGIVVVGGSRLQQVPFGDGPITNLAFTDGQTFGVDALAGQYYFTAVSAARLGQVWRVNADGSGQTLLVQRPIDTRPRQIQVFDNHLYWNETNGQFYRSNLDGSGVQPFMQTDSLLHNSSQFAIGNGRLYWLGVSTTQLFSRRLDGSDYQVQPLGDFADTLSSIHSYGSGLIVMIGNNSTLNQPPSRVVKLDFATGQFTNLFSQVLPGNRFLGSANVFGDRAYFDVEGNGPTTMYSVPLSGGPMLTEYTTTTTHYSLYQMMLVPSPASAVPLVCAVMATARRRRR